MFNEYLLEIFDMKGNLVYMCECMYVCVFVYE